MIKLSLFLGEMLVGAAKALFMDEISTGQLNHVPNSELYQAVNPHPPRDRRDLTSAACTRGV